MILVYNFDSYMKIIVFYFLGDSSRERRGDLRESISEFNFLFDFRVSCVYMQCDNWGKINCLQTYLA